MFGILSLFRTLLKILLLLLNQIWTPHLPCLNSIVLSVEQKRDVHLNLPMETLRLLPHPIKRLLLQHYNDCLLSGTAPDHWKLSKVVMILRVTKRTADRLPAIDLFHWPTQSIKSTRVCFNKDWPTLLAISFTPTSTDSEQDDPSLPLFFFSAV